MGKVAEGIRLPNRAQALTFPLIPVRGVATAIHTTKNLIHSVQQSIGFDRVLAGDPIDSSEPESTQSLLDQSAAAIRRQLNSDGLEPTRLLSFKSMADGSVQLESTHDHAAAIEASVSSDGALQRLVAKLHARLGTTRIEVAPDR